MRKSHNLTHLSMRLHEDLRHRLEQQAERHRITLANEIRIRLEDSFTRDNQRTLEDTILDMSVAWGRFSARFLRMSLGDELADAVATGSDPKKIATLAKLIIQHRDSEQRKTTLLGDTP